jgi:hypothetical protein
MMIDKSRRISLIFYCHKVNNLFVPFMFVIGVILSLVQSVGAQTQHLKENSPLRKLAENFVSARNESDMPAGPDWEKVNFKMPISSAGGAFSNTTDLLRFSNALLANKHYTLYQ